MKRKFRLFFVLNSLVLMGLTGLLPAAAQAPATPIPVIPPTATPTDLPPTDQPTRTPTSLGPASAVALSEGTNVRSQPDISAEQLGQIAPNESFSVLGKRFEWYQIQFPDAPGGVGWVHESVVQINGDPSLIPDFSEVPTENPAITSGRQTMEAVTQTPGFSMTLTAVVQITPSGVFTVGAADADNPNAPVSGGGSGNALLPTFTFPAVTATPIDLIKLRGSTPVNSDTGLPPIFPIVTLIGVGGLGLMIALLRR